MDILLVQVILGVVLFFLINWIGNHSYSIGYMEISIFVKNEEAPALNFLIRVLTPIVYIIVASAVLYYFGHDKYVRNIYLVNIYYIVFRLLFNLVTNRGHLLNWNRQFLYWISIIAISLIVYSKLIKVKTNILPDFTTLANEIWIIILIFIFQIINNLRFSQENSEKRKQKYLEIRYHKFESLYGKLIKETTKNEVLECITYAIIIYEDFNRPKIARYIERQKFRLTKKQHTLGLMQVKSDKLVSDYESVQIGTQKIVAAYKNYIEQVKMIGEDFNEYKAQCAIIEDYNTGSSYCTEVNDLSYIIKNTFYKETNDTLEPNTKADLSQVFG